MLSDIKEKIKNIVKIFKDMSQPNTTVIKVYRVEAGVVFAVALIYSFIKYIFLKSSTLVQFKVANMYLIHFDILLAICGLLLLICSFKCISYVIRLICLITLSIIFSPILLLFIFMALILKFLYDEKIVYEVAMADWTVILFAVLLFFIEVLFCIKYYENLFIVVCVSILIRIFLVVLYYILYKIFGEKFNLVLANNKIIILTTFECLIFYIFYFSNYNNFCNCKELNYIKDYITLFTLISMFFEKRKLNKKAS